MKSNYNIAIDGPTGAGKSTIAKKVAAKLGFTYVDTGAMYRALAYSCISAGVDPADEQGVCDAIKDLSLYIKYEDGVQKVVVNDEDVSPYLRREEVGNAASNISAYAGVREKLLDLQRKMGEDFDIVMDGRDIGTVVLPDAFLKIYLTASASERARRRYDQLVAKGETPSLEKIEEDLIERDRKDMSRAIAPLKQAEDAVLVDSTFMSEEQVLDAIIMNFEERK